MGGKSNKVQKTEEQKELERIAFDQLRDYEARGFGQLMDRYIADTMDSGPEMKQARGIATAETARAFSGARGLAETAARRRGANPATAIGGLAIDEGTSGGLGLTDTTQAVRDTRLRSLGDLVAVGRGEKVEATGGLSRVADMSGRQAVIDAETALQNRAGLQSAALTGAGLATYYGMNRKPPLAVGTYGGPQLNNPDDPAGLGAVQYGGR